MRSLIIAIITFITLSFNLQSQQVLIYSDDGAWEDGVIALEHFFDNQNITHTRLYAADLNADIWNKEALAIVFPGGYAYNYQIAISWSAINEIRSYVAKGGGYIGICAGAYFASKIVAWEDEKYPYELALFDGMAFGSLKYIAPWPNYAMTDITLNPNNPINTGKPAKNTVLYYGGPIFKPNAGVQVDTIATWDAAENTLAIINFEYEKGKVLLIGPHLEIEENDDRDGTDFASELDDVESDWAVLASAFKWLTNSPQSSVETDEINTSISVYPNPVSDILTIINNSNNRFISYSIFNSVGKKVLTNSVFENSINISSLVDGVYNLELKTKDGKIIRKSFVVN